MGRRRGAEAWGSPGRATGTALVHQHVERRWELAPRQVDRDDRGWAGRAGSTVIAAVWATGTAVLGFLTAGAIGTPLDAGVQLAAFPEDWAAVPVTTLLAVPLTLWVAGGVGLALRIRFGHLASVVTVGSRGIRVVEHYRRGGDVVLERAWDELDDVVLDEHRVLVTGRRGEATLAAVGTPQQRSEIAAAVTSHLSEHDRVPVLTGWWTYLGDDGPTIATTRREQRQAAAVCGVTAVVAWANGGAFSVGMATNPLWVWLVVPSVMVAGTMTAAAYGHARWTPRWTARPGAVVLVRRPGRGVSFEARSLEHEEQGRSDGTSRHALVAVSTRDGDGMADRHAILSSPASQGDVRAAGTWLAASAEIPFRYRFLPYEPPS